MPEPTPVLTVAARTLCEFTARRGDLDLRFTPSPTAQQGIEGHQRVTARRGAGYETEVPLALRHGNLQVRGRADGFDPALGRLEEIKTHRVALDRQPAHHRALHLAQLRLYGAMLCAERELPRLRLALVYLHLGTGEETVVEEEQDASELQRFFEASCEAYAAWARQEADHRTRRDDALRDLPFPHDGFRPGQRELAAAVWRACARGLPLMAQAPTGIGKTIATLYPTLRAMPAHALDRAFFLTARTTGRQLALDGLQRLRAGGALPLRVLELTARDTACEHPDKTCDGASCPLARGFFDRLPAARAEAAQAGWLAAADLRGIALRHEVCPYWLSQEMARWCDLVVGDYNHFFDVTALLHALALDQEWRCAVLADEAHNLPDRARQMYSASLDEARWRALRRAPGVPGTLRKPVDRLLRCWRDWRKALPELPALADELPEGLVTALQQVSTALSDALAESGEAAGDAAAAPLLQEAWFEALAFLRLAERFGPHSCLELAPLARAPRPSTVLTLRNLLPAPHLQDRWKAAHAAVLFSATLGPPDFGRDLLGLPAGAGWVDIPSPFEARQLAAWLVPQISTRWTDRQRSVAPIAGLIATQWRTRPGNYLAFFSSHDYLQQVLAALAQAAPDIPCWAQSRDMGEAQRQAFIERFTPGGQGIGFAVLGGAFGEGIDLPGDRLVGAFVATLGLPQVNPLNERLRQCLQDAFGAGFDYAYLVPGLRKVVQAAGRVIRTPEDQGTVFLIDDRFCRAEVRDLLPAWWEPAVWRQAVTDGPRPAG